MFAKSQIKGPENELKTVYQMVYRFVFVSHCSLHKSSGAWKNREKASYNTRVTNIFRKRASKLIPPDSYMCELGYFFSFYSAAYLATKFLILMEILGRSGKAVRGPFRTRQKLHLSFMHLFKLGLLLLAV